MYWIYIYKRKAISIFMQIKKKGTIKKSEILETLFSASSNKN